MWRLLLILLALACLIPFLAPLFLALALFVLIEWIGFLPVVVLGFCLWLFVKDR